MKVKDGSQPIDGWLTLRICAVLVAVSALLPFVKVKDLLRRLSPSVMPPRQELAKVQAVVRHLDGVLRRAPTLPFGYCLLRSLTLYYFCTRLGYPVRVSFGTRLRAEGGLDAHGWLVLDGSPFMERGDPHGSYATVWCLPEIEV